MAKSSKASFYIPSLDGIRAVAFAIVFVAHAGLGNLVPGGFGVTIFFFLSGFLITTLMRKEHAQNGSIDLGRFYLRRVLRIFPPFYITLGLLVLVTMAGVLPGRLGFGAIAAQAAFLANYYTIYATSMPAWPAGTDVFWSLAVEEHFYFLFPLAAIALLGRTTGRAQGWILAAGCTGFLAWRCVLVYGMGVGESRIYLASDTRMDSILFGSLLAMACNPMLDPRPAIGPRAKWAVYAGSVGLLLFCLLYRNSSFRETFRYTLQGIGLLPLFYLAVAEPDRPWFRWLNWRWVRFCGLLSYSLYLIHFSALKLVPHLFPNLKVSVQGLVALAISLGYSITLYYAVERPMASLRKRLHSDSLPPSARPPEVEEGPRQALVASLPDSP